MAVSRVQTSSILQGFPKSRSLLAGNAAYNPGATFLIDSVTVGAGGVSTVSFSSIPSTYQHLQLRGFIADNATNGNFALKYNGSYATFGHQLQGDGTSAIGDSYGSTSAGLIYAQRTNTGQFVFVTDILDYANPNKNKTARSLAGGDNNGAGRINLASNFINSTSAITSLDLYFSTGTIPQYSKISLYGYMGS